MAETPEDSCCYCNVSRAAYDQPFSYQLCTEAILTLLGKLNKQHIAGNNVYYIINIRPVQALHSKVTS